MVIDTAFVLAAGKGTRMAPLTDTVPKPLVCLHGRPLLDYVFDHLRNAGVSKAVVNSFHHADVLHEYLGAIGRPDIMISHEEKLLETGGGLKNAAPLLGADPFFMINGDAYWEDGVAGDALSRLADGFDPQQMDILMLLIPVKNMVLTQGVGDYDWFENGQAVRRKDQLGTHMFTGIRVVNPAIFSYMESGVYSFLEQMDEAEAKGRLFAIEHDGVWHHISTPEDVGMVEKTLV
ncbi:MAG TPA: nucleotidyltransferase family protein [Alphaproteobacteria bacterium]|nr:nucleotidyltransferase family protein [Alphaproteobacteria bacterium]